MKKIILILSFLPLLTSCLYNMPKRSDILELAIKEQKFNDIYLFSQNSAVDNIVVPEKDRNNPYTAIYYVLGNRFNEECLYIYGYQEWGVLFEPYEYDIPLKSSYDDVINMFNQNVKSKEFKKVKEDNIQILTITSMIDQYFVRDEDRPDNDFVFTYENRHFVYELNNKLKYSYI